MRSTTLEFGRALAAGQTRATLLAADFGHRNYEPSIELDPNVVTLDPVANADRALMTERGIMRAMVSFQEDVCRISGMGNPAFFSILAASGFKIESDTATFGNVAYNDNSLTCELFDGITKTSAWGVRGNVKLAAAKPGDRLMVTFSGTGHGEETDQVAWPAGVTEVTTPSAILAACTLTLGDFTPELRSFELATEGEPTMIDDALASDGFVEAFLAKQSIALRMGIYQHTKADRDWLGHILASTNKHALAFTVPMGSGMELSITGSLMLSKKPVRAAEGNVGTYPLEFNFDRTAPVAIEYRAAA